MVHREKIIARQIHSKCAEGSEVAKTMKSLSVTRHSKHTRKDLFLDLSNLCPLISNGKMKGQTSAEHGYLSTANTTTWRQVFWVLNDS